MISSRTAVFTALTMVAFAGNSLLCRLALAHTTIDAASFTSVRLISGALTLWAIVSLGKTKRSTSHQTGRWVAAVALFIYAACFSIAYLSLPAGVGALILFGSVQITMISYGLWAGERLGATQIVGLILALGGLIGLMVPGLAVPSLQGSLLMVTAGVGWGAYSLLAKGVKNPIQVTAHNFLRAVPFTLGLSWLAYSQRSLDLPGVLYGVASGAIASGLGYALWYRTVPELKATQAATVQLSVPILATLMAIPLLQEPMIVRLGIATLFVLGGIALVIVSGNEAKATK